MNDLWPSELPGSNPAAPYINRLRAAAKASQIRDVKFPGGQSKLIPNPDGQTLVLSTNPSAQLETFFPFKIYPMPNVVDPTLSALTYQVRSGYVSWRSAYKLTVPLMGEAFSPMGNNEQLIYCLCTDFTTNFQAQPTAGTGGNVPLANATDTLIFDPTGGSFAYAQVVINADLDANNQRLFSFWINIVDNPDPLIGVYAQLWGRMWTTDVVNVLGRNSQPFPGGYSTIPLGFYDGTDAGIVTQLQFNNVLNRFSPSPSGSLVSPAGILRGYWSEIIAASPTGQIFWSGDRVVDDTVIIKTDGTNDFYGTYTFKAPYALQSLSPSTNLTNWRLDGVIIL